MIVGHCWPLSVIDWGEAVWMRSASMAEGVVSHCEQRREPSFGSVERRLTAHREASMKND
jgi:hypothetical protein